MKEELEDKLVRDFPNLYRQVNDTPMETCMCWGFECDDGWFELIYELSKKITLIDPEVQAMQVKEKYGGLRFYVGGVDKDLADEVFDLISEYEDKSYTICESCGTNENVTVNDSGWIYTLCDKCRKERQKSKKDVNEIITMFEKDPDKMFKMIEENVNDWMNKRIKKMKNEETKKKWMNWWEETFKKGVNKN